MSPCNHLSNSNLFRGMLLTYQGSIPSIDDSVFIVPNASVIGDAQMIVGSSIWFGAIEDKL